MEVQIYLFLVLCAVGTMICEAQTTTGAPVRTSLPATTSRATTLRRNLPATTSRLTTSRSTTSRTLPVTTTRTLAGTSTTTTLSNTSVTNADKHKLPTLYWGIIGGGAALFSLIIIVGLAAICRRGNSKCRQRHPTRARRGSDTNPLGRDDDVEAVFANVLASIKHRTSAMFDSKRPDDETAVTNEEMASTKVHMIELKVMPKSVDVDAGSDDNSQENIYMNDNKKQGGLLNKSNTIFPEDHDIPKMPPLPLNANNPCTDEQTEYPVEEEYVYATPMSNGGAQAGNEGAATDEVDYVNLHSMSTDDVEYTTVGVADEKNKGDIRDDDDDDAHEYDLPPVEDVDGDQKTVSPLHYKPTTNYYKNQPERPKGRKQALMATNGSHHT